MKIKVVLFDAFVAFFYASDGGKKERKNVFGDDVRAVVRDVAYGNILFLCGF